jgi:hypothetical protein
VLDDGFGIELLEMLGFIGNQESIYSTTPVCLHSISYRKSQNFIGSQLLNLLEIYRGCQCGTLQHRAGLGATAPELSESPLIKVKCPTASLAITTRSRRGHNSRNETTGINMVQSGAVAVIPAQCMKL